MESEVKGLGKGLVLYGRQSKRAWKGADAIWETE